MNPKSVPQSHKPSISLNPLQFPTSQCSHKPTISANSFLISHKPFSQWNPILFTNSFTNHALTPCDAQSALTNIAGSVFLWMLH
jgi:hypothetical protein